MTVTFTGHLGDLGWGSSRRWNSWVEFHAGNTLIASSANGDFAVADGQVTEDISRSIRRDATVTLLFPQNAQRRTVGVYSQVTSGSPFEVGDDEVGDVEMVGGGTSVEELSIPPVTSDTARSVFIPTQVGDLLDPHSLATMRIYAGFEGEEVLLGFFDLAETPVRVEGGGAVVDVTAHSFERRLERAGFWNMNPYPASTPAIDAVLVLIGEAIRGTPILTAASGATIGELTWKPGDNRLSKITELLGICGMEGGFNRSNTYVIQPAPTASDFGTQSPRWDIIDGVNARIATLNAASRTFSDSDSYNGVVIEGTGQDNPQDNPIYSARWNLNPTSPLYFDPDNPQASPMGARPKHISSELVKSQTDADAMATVELAKVLMVTDSIEVEVPANAELEMGQYVRFACDAIGADGVYRVNRVVHNLAGGATSLTLYRFTGV